MILQVKEYVYVVVICVVVRDVRRCCRAARPPLRRSRASSCPCRHHRRFATVVMPKQKSIITRFGEPRYWISGPRLPGDHHLHRRLDVRFRLAFDRYRLRLTSAADVRPTVLCCCCSCCNRWSPVSLSASIRPSSPSPSPPPPSAAVADFAAADACCCV